MRPLAPIDRFAALVVLTTFGVTWPVLQILADNAEFFLARDSSTVEILLLGATLLVGLPLLVGLMGFIPGRTGRVIGDTLILVTATSLAHLYMGKTTLPWWLSVTISVAAGACLLWLIHRYAGARLATRYLLLAPLALIGVFAFTTPTGAVLLDQGVGVGAPVDVGNPTPILFMVFDEFPVASLIDPMGNLRDDRYPNLARLAADGVWFRNAMTIEQQTEHSVPAILTGVDADHSLTPFAGHYPDNIFTALQQAYELHVNETITGLCPSRLCGGASGPAPPIIADVLVVAGHVLLPEPATTGLPAIDQTWGDFSYVPEDFNAVAEFQESLRGDRRDDIEGLIEEIDSYDGSLPPFFFLHALLPHHPWQYLPDGREYPLVIQANPASNRGGWIDDEFLVAQGMQRHLLQVGYVDHALGQVMDALEGAGLYEDAVIVLVADHGVAIKPGVEHQRKITESLVGEIAAVPLFIKAPGLEPGVIDDRRAMTIDIVPTIADIIGASLGWDTEGLSLLQPDPGRTESVTIGPGRRVTYGVAGEEKLAVAARIEELFPDGDPWALQPKGSPDIVGEAIPVDGLPQSNLRAQLRSADLYDDVDTTSDRIPVRVVGYISGQANGDEVLAVLVNGVVGALTRTYVDDSRVGFMAMVRPDLFVDGANDIDIIEVRDDGELRHLALS